jgi:hypothetical protein
MFQIPGHDQVYINDPRLSDFKQILQKNGVQAEFAGGVLVCCSGALAITRVSHFLFLTNVGSGNNKKVLDWIDRDIHTEV